MTEKNNAEVIDLGKLIKKVWHEKKLFYKVWPITFVVSSLIIICVPRTYTSEAKLAPEMGSSMAEGTLGSIASSFGFDLGNMQTSDAINPMLYPDLMDDNGFVASLFSIRVKDSEGEIDTDYYTYLRKYQDQAWWSAITTWIKKMLTPKDNDDAKEKPFDPYYMSKVDDGVAEMIRDMVSFSLDKKTGVIGITVKAQDKLICKTVNDSVSKRLQEFITEYRTKKATIDVEYYAQLRQEALKEYDSARIAYAIYADANANPVLQSVKGKVEQLENDMALKFNTYSTLNAQYEAARAKVQERTPAFTTLQGAKVPIKPTGPKRVIFVIAMLFLATMVSVIYVIKDDLLGTASAQQ